jgi:hypothetical protein
MEEQGTTTSTSETTPQEPAQAQENPFLVGLADRQPTPAAADEAPPADPTPPPEKPAASPPADPPVSSRLAVAARLEREIRQRERALKEREAQLASAPDLRAIGKADPMAALKELGWTYEALTDHILEHGAGPAKQTPEEIAARVAREAAADEWTRRQEAHTKAAAEEQRRQYEAFRARQIREIAESAAADGEFELAHLSDASDSVMSYVEDAAQAGAKIPSRREAMERIEKGLADELESILRKSKKAQAIARAILSEQTARVPTASGTRQAVATTPTLTNRGASEVAVTQRDAPYSERDAIEAAARMLRFT